MSQTGGQERFLSLLDEHRKILYKVANSYCRNPADRPDLVQEIAIQLWRSFDRYDDRLRFSTWMYRVALNVAISFYRMEARRSRHLVPADDSILELPEAAGEPDERARLLEEWIQRLGDLDRALVLLYLDDLPHETIAEILGISQTNVGTKIGRIKERIRRDFQQTAS